MEATNKDIAMNYLQMQNEKQLAELEEMLVEAKRQDNLSQQRTLQKTIESIRSNMRAI